MVRTRPVIRQTRHNWPIVGQYDLVGGRVYFVALLKTSFIEMNAIAALLTNPFLRRDTAQQLKIKELGRPTPVLTLSSTQNVKEKPRTRKFNFEIYSQHDWIAGCEITDALYCFPCVLFAGESPWATTGYKDLIHLSNAITKHELDSTHIHNVINYSTIGKISSNEQKKAAERRNNEVEKNLQVLELLIDSIKLSGQGYIPIMKKTFDEDDDDYYMMDNDAFQGLLDLVSDFNSTLKTYLKLDIFKNDMESIKVDIVNAAFKVYQSEVLQEIKKAEFLAIIIEDLNVQVLDDCSKVFILRYVAGGKPVERVWKLIKYENDDTFFEILKGEINLLVTDPNKLISQSYQELNLKPRGNIRGLHTEIQSIYPNAQLVHFYRHGLYDIIVNTLDFNMEVRLFFCRVWCICDFFIKEPYAQITLHVFEKIVENKKNKPKWDFVDDRINTVYNYQAELLETMDSIQQNALNYHEKIISKAYNLALDLEDDDFDYWLQSFHRIMPHIERYLNEYESCLKPLDPEFSTMLTKENIDRILEADAQVPVSTENPHAIPVKIEEDIEIFQGNLEDVKMEIDYTYSENTIEEKPSISTLSSVSRKRKLNDNKKELEEDTVNCIMLQLQERLKFRGHKFASNLVDIKSFQQYHSDFPDSFMDITIQCFPILNSIRLRSELSVLYERLEYRSLEGANALLKDILESKLQSTFQQTVKLLNIVLTVPTKSTEPSRCFSTLSETEFYLKNCRDSELLHSLLPLACEKEFIDNIFEFNKKVVQIFAEKPERVEHFKRLTLPAEN